MLFQLSLSQTNQWTDETKYDTQKLFPCNCDSNSWDFTTLTFYLYFAQNASPIKSALPWVCFVAINAMIVSTFVYILSWYILVNVLKSQNEESSTIFKKLKLIIVCHWIYLGTRVFSPSSVTINQRLTTHVKYTVEYLKVNIYNVTFINIYLI